MNNNQIPRLDDQNTINNNTKIETLENTTSMNQNVLKDYGQPQSIQQPVPTNNVENINSVNHINSVAPPTVTPPSVTPPKVTTPPVPTQKLAQANNKDEEDNRILKPITKEVEILDDSNIPTKLGEEKEKESEEKKEQPPKKEILENAKMKEIKIDYKPPGRFKVFLLFVLFGGFLGAILFLPQITEYIEKLQEQRTNTQETETTIVNGTLSCSLETTNNRFDLIYTYDFHYKENGLQSLNYTDTTKGNRVVDSEELDLYYNSCKALSKELETIQGVTMSCDLYDGTFHKSQTIDYTLLNTTNASTVYKKYSIELPRYEKNENIDDIERKMVTNGYSCERVKENK